MHKCTEMYSEPDIQNLDNLRPEPERAEMQRRETECRHSEDTSPRVSRSMKPALAAATYVQIMSNCLA